MNRTDRLHAIGEELRRAGPRGRTSAQLAARFEVSVRTVKRDLDALQQAGLPVWAQPGPGGGYVLDATATLPPVNLTPAQAVAVAVALAAAADGPYAEDGRAALAKLHDALGPQARQRTRDLAARVWVRPGPAASGDPAVRRCLEEALARRVVVSLDYLDAAGRASHRRVEPHLLAREGSRWYLVAWCLERDAARWFRLERILRARRSTEPVPERAVADFGAPPPGARTVAEEPHP